MFCPLAFSLCIKDNSTDKDNSGGGGGGGGRGGGVNPGSNHVLQGGMFK